MGKAKNLYFYFNEENRNEDETESNFYRNILHHSFKRIYQCSMSVFIDEALDVDCLVFPVKGGWGMYICGHDQFSQNNMLENGFKFG